MYFEVVDGVHQLGVHIVAGTSVSGLRVDDVFTQKSSPMLILAQRNHKIWGIDVLVFGRFFFFPVGSCDASGVDTAGGAWEEDGSDECHDFVLTDDNVFLKAAASRWRLDIVLDSSQMVVKSKCEWHK